jgi:non-ribosomal peptide synthetase component E (peptide arylation enzyme)
MHFADMWEAVADTLPDQEVLVCGENRRTWREFDDRSARLAQAFTEAGIKPDSESGVLSLQWQ